MIVEFDTARLPHKDPLLCRMNQGLSDGFKWRKQSLVHSPSLSMYRIFSEETGALISHQFLMHSDDLTRLLWRFTVSSEGNSFVRVISAGLLEGSRSLNQKPKSPQMFKNEVSSGFVASVGSLD